MKPLKNLSQYNFSFYWDRFKQLFSIFAILGILGMVNQNRGAAEQEMKLINLKSGFVVAEYRGDKTIIHDRILEKEMTARGVAIPPPLRAEFNGKDAILLSDKEFQRAFKEIYSPQVFNPKSYSWED